MIGEDLNSAKLAASRKPKLQVWAHLSYFGKERFG